MQKPEIRQIESQQVDSVREVTGWEAEEILRKYGHQVSHSTRPVERKPEDDMTFEQLVALEEQKIRDEENRRRSALHGPKPTTFSGKNGYDSEVKYGQDEDLGFGYKIEITTDMNLPKY